MAEAKGWMTMLREATTAIQTIAVAQREQARASERFNELYAEMARHQRDLAEGVQALTQEILTQLEKDEGGG